MTETIAATETSGSKLPVTRDDSCYLCDQQATHVGFASLGLVGANVGLCEDCWTMKYSDYKTSIDPEGTRNHKRVEYPGDDNPGYYYETDEGAYIITKNMGVWDEAGPHEESSFIEVARGGDATITDISAHEIPAVAGNAVERPEKTMVDATCPECGTSATITLDQLREHNESRHDGDPIAHEADDTDNADSEDNQ